MKTTLLILSLIFITCNSLRHTKIFNEKGINNANYFYFDDRTFGKNIYTDPCTVIDDNKVFRTYVNNKFKCTGKHCIDKLNFGCKRYGTDCYHVEHIIDLNGKDFAYPENCKNIAANMVMAYGRWNKALGGLAHYHYEDSQQEKISIYGKSNVDNVMKYIRYCCDIRHIDINTNTNNFIANNLSYDPTCDSQDNCDCDGDTECGCDCSNNDIVINRDYKIYIIAMVCAACIAILIMICVPIIACIIKQRNKKYTNMIT